MVLNVAYLFHYYSYKLILISLHLYSLYKNNDILVEFLFRNEIKVLQEYKEKAHRELCRVRDEQKTFGKIKVNTEL